MVALLIPAFVLLAVIAGLLALASASRRRGRTGSGVDARSVRRFFQYAVLYGLGVLAAVGVQGLVARALTGGPSDLARGALAESLAYALVGLPLALVLGWWTRRSLRADPSEGLSPLYAGYVTLAALTGVVGGVIGLQALASSAILAQPPDPDGAGGLLAWGALWAVHWAAARRTLSGPARTPHLMLGSLLGLALAAFGLAFTLGHAVDLLSVQGRPTWIYGGRSQLAGDLGLLLGGGLVWIRYWLTAAAREPRRLGWLALVLVGGVGGGLVMALVAASRLLWRVLVWVVGDRLADDAARHFDGVGVEAALLLTGLVVSWYHRSVLGDLRGDRDEVRRVYEYLVAGLALIAAASGVGTLLVSLIEATTPGVDVGLSVRNTLLAAMTLLAVGVPVWWLFWARIRAATSADPQREVTSLTRRIYLVLLFGVAGVAAVLALVTVALTFFTDLVAAQLSAATLRSMRYGLGVLVAAAAVSAYHGAIFRADRDVPRPQQDAAAAGPRSIVLVGDTGGDLAGELSRAVGAPVEVWARPGEPAPGWDLGGLVELVEGHAGEDLLVLEAPSGPHLLVVDRDGQASTGR